MVRESPSTNRAIAFNNPSTFFMNRIKIQKPTFALQLSPLGQTTLARLSVVMSAWS